MDNNSSFDELIEQYLSGKLNQKDQQTFEAEVKNNPELANQLKIYQQARMAIFLTGSSDLLQKFQDKNKSWTEADLPEARIVPFFKRPTVQMMVAAIVLLLVAVILIFRSPSSTIIGDSFYAQQIQEAEEQLFSISLGNDKDSLKAHFQLLYHTQKYEELIKSLESLTQEQSERKFWATFLLGMVYFKQDQVDSAIREFAKFPDHSIPFSEQAQWYHALALWKSGKTDQAVPIFHDISQTNHYKRDEAVRIMDKVNK